jgi:glutaredoxin
MVLVVNVVQLTTLVFSGAQGPQLQKVLERLTGQSTVPNVFIGKSKFVLDLVFFSFVHHLSSINTL